MKLLTKEIEAKLPPFYAHEDHAHEDHTRWSGGGVDAMETMGWIVTMDQVLHYLSVVGADRDEGGKFLVRGDVSSFMGAGEEVVVHGEAVYFAGGRECRLAAGLRATSYGQHVVVI